MTLKWMKRPQPELVARASIWQVRMREVAGGVVFSPGPIPFSRSNAVLGLVRLRQ